jgi:hypothetical protein
MSRLNACLPRRTTNDAVVGPQAAIPDSETENAN